MNNIFKSVRHPRKTLGKERDCSQSTRPLTSVFFLFYRTLIVADVSKSCSLKMFSHSTEWEEAALCKLSNHLVSHENCVLEEMLKDERLLPIKRPLLSQCKVLLIERGCFGKKNEEDCIG